MTQFSHPNSTTHCITFTTEEKNNLSAVFRTAANQPIAILSKLLGYCQIGSVNISSCMNAVVWWWWHTGMAMAHMILGTHTIIQSSFNSHISRSNVPRQRHTNTHHPAHTLMSYFFPYTLAFYCCSNNNDQHFNSSNRTSCTQKNRMTH